MIGLCPSLTDFAESWHRTLMHYGSGLVTEAEDDWRDRRLQVAMQR